jgi:diguanylate cyclase (GGDEF)-like protein
MLNQNTNTNQMLQEPSYLKSLTENPYTDPHVSFPIQEKDLIDPLTNLANRFFFIQQLEYNLQEAHHGKSCTCINQPSGSTFAVLCLNVNRFRLINDSLGHSIGDRLLIEIARRIKRCIRSEDIFARLGGDKFAILLKSIDDVSKAQQVAERVQAVLSFPIKLENQEVFTSVTIGITLSSDSEIQAENLLWRAETAMYRAKTSKHETCVVYEPTMNAQALSRLQFETDLRRAVEELFLNQATQLCLYYQPIVELATNKIIGFEALLRWLHPEWGLVSPVEFIPIIEEIGLIAPLGRWVLYEACRQLKQWQAQLDWEFPLTMSVNVSSRQFLQPEFVGQVQEILHLTQTDANCLKLEITESSLMNITEAVLNQLEQLQSLGVRLALDDFGTGYSSLNYLHRLPVHTLKVDRSFVQEMTISQDRVVRAIVALSHSFGMDVTAEGIETLEQITHLRAIGCEFGQGYFFSQPLTKDRAGQLLMESCSS